MTTTYESIDPSSTTETAYSHIEKKPEHVYENTEAEHDYEEAPWRYCASVLFFMFYCRLCYTVKRPWTAL